MELLDEIYFKSVQVNRSHPATETNTMKSTFNSTTGGDSTISSLTTRPMTIHNGTKRGFKPGDNMYVSPVNFRGEFPGMVGHVF